MFVCLIVYMFGFHKKKNHFEKKKKKKKLNPQMNPYIVFNSLFN